LFDGIFGANFAERRRQAAVPTGPNQYITDLLAQHGEMLMLRWLNCLRGRLHQ
jgi:hypothetical protein